MAFTRYPVKGQAVQLWWTAVHKEHTLFFELMELDSTRLSRLPNLEATLHRLETETAVIENMPAPAEATVLRSYLLTATQKLHDSLHHAIEGRFYESDMSFMVAGVDLTMIQHTLLQMGIFA